MDLGAGPQAGERVHGGHTGSMVQPGGDQGCRFRLGQEISSPEKMKGKLDNRQGS